MKLWISGFQTDTGVPTKLAAWQKTDEKIKVDLRFICYSFGNSDEGQHISKQKMLRMVVDKGSPASEWRNNI